MSLVFDKGCRTVDDKLAFLTELKERFRLWHNAKVKGKSWAEAKAFFDSKFYAKAAELERIINQLADFSPAPEGDGIIKARPPLTDKWGPALELLDYVGDRIADVFDPLEDFTTYTEVDPNNRFGVASDEITINGLTLNEDAYIYIDKGAGYFSGDYEHLIEVEVTSGTDAAVPAPPIFNCDVLANAVDDNWGIRNSGGDMLLMQVYRSAASDKPILQLQEVDGGTAYNDFYIGEFSTPYYLKDKRDEAVGTYGTLFGFIYDNAPRSNLLDTLSIALHTSKKDFRHAYAVQSFNIGAAHEITGFVRGYDLQDAGSVVIPPHIFQQRVLS